MKQPRRPRWVPMPPPGLRPKLSRGQVTDLGLAHLANVDAIARGAGTPDILHQHCGGALTWLFAAEIMAGRDPEHFSEVLRVMQASVAACKDIADRYRRTGRVGFSGLEYQMAREAVEWMDALAAVVEKDVAIVAAEAGERMLQAVVGEAEEMALSAATYAEQLKHPKWQEKRLRVLDRANWQCQRCCNRDRTLHAHHKVYLKGHKPWEYEDDLLECLCEVCHDKAHAERDELDYMVALQPTARVPLVTDAVYAALSNDQADAALPPKARAVFREMALALAGSDPPALTTAHNRMQDLIDEYRDFRRGPGGAA